MKNDWIKDIPAFENFFPQSQQKLIELLGIEKYLEVHDYFAKTSFYFSDVPITALKKAWALKNKHIPYNEAARILNVSVQSIYNWRDKSNHENLELFDEKKDEAKTK